MDKKYILSDLKTTVYNYETQFHVLRHFNVIDTSYRNELQENLGCADDGINEQLNLTGSKFNKGFSISPKELINNIVDNCKTINAELTEDSDKIVIQIQYPKNKFNGGIGTDSIIGVNELSDIEKGRVEIIKRDKNIVSTIKRDFIKTWQLNIIVGKTAEDKYYIRTLFPGKLAPAFPNKKKQSYDEYNISRTFWKDHIFITATD